MLFATVAVLLEAYNILRDAPRHRHHAKQNPRPGTIFPAYADVVRWMHHNQPQADDTNLAKKRQASAYAATGNTVHLRKEPDGTINSAYRTLINGRMNISQKVSGSNAGARGNSFRRARATTIVKKVKIAWIANNVPFPLDDFRDRYTNGHRVRGLCRLGRVETLFFVHTDPNRVAERGFYRSTIGHASLESLYRWTLVFFVGTGPNVNLTVEGLRNGDIVQLPFVDSYRNLTYKFLYGMRWVLLNCPKVQTIVKLDDDVFVHVPMLNVYLQRYVNTKEMSIHCSVIKGNIVVRNPNSRLYLNEKEYTKKTFPRHCRGWAAIFPAWVMFPLYAAAFHVPLYGRDQAYVTGDLALKAGVGHRDISVVMSDIEEKVLETVEGEYIFALFPGRRKLKLRAMLWKTMVQMRHRKEVEATLDRTLV